MIKLEEEIDKLIALEASRKLSKPKLKKVRQKIIDLMTLENVKELLIAGEKTKIMAFLYNDGGGVSSIIFNKVNRMTKSKFYQGQRREEIAASKTSFTRKEGNGHR